MGQTVLVVDDELMIRQVLARILTRLGHRPVLAADEPSARSALVEGEPISLVFLDLNLGHQSGLLVGHALHDWAPELPIVLMSGDHSLKCPPWARLVLRKPFVADDVAATLQPLCHTFG